MSTEIQTVGQLLLQCLPWVNSALGPAAIGVLSTILNEAVVVAVVESGKHGVQASREGLTQLKAAILRYAEKEQSAPGNHDLQRAFYASFLKATDVVYQNRLKELGMEFELSYMAGLKRAILKEFPSRSLTTLSSLSPNDKEIIIEKRQQLRLQLERCWGMSPEEIAAHLPFDVDVEVLNHLAADPSRDTASLGGRLLDTVIAQSPWFRDLSQQVHKIARDTLWRDLGAFFAEEIKTNGRVQAIMTAELLAETGFTVDNIRDNLQSVAISIDKLKEELASLKEAVQLEFQRVFSVIDMDFLERQRHGPLNPLLSIVAGDWASVSRNQTLERDLAEILTARVLESDDRAALQIIRGEPGSGKTTLLLQIGARLAMHGCAVLQAQAAADFSEFLYYARKLAAVAKSRLFILVDDIYRDDDRAIIIEVLSSIGERLPVTIIATTPSFQDRTREIKENNFWTKMPVASPDRLSNRELDDLRRLPMCAHVTGAEFRRLTATPRILVVMLQLGGGATLKHIMFKVARRLKEKYPTTYKAWRVVVTFGRWNLPVPTSLLEPLIGEPYFGDALRTNPERIGSEGIIFPLHTPFPESWSAGHQVIAVTAFDAIFSDALRAVCERTVAVSQVDNLEHALFLGRALRALSAKSRLGQSTLGDPGLASQLLEKNEPKLLALALHSPQAHVDWARAFRELGKDDLAGKCLLASAPTSSAGALAVVGDLESLGRSTDAIRVGHEWLGNHDGDQVVRHFCLGLVERQGDKAQIKDAITGAEKWLAKHEENTHIRTFYLGLVERQGDKTQIIDVIAGTALWLAKHEEDTAVRTFYLGLVERQGDKTQIIDVIAGTAQWLAKHEINAGVRTFYLGLVERQGDKTQIRDAITGTEQWLVKHEENTDVRTFYLGLVERQGDKAQIRDAITGTEQWLAKHEENTAVRTFYLGLVERQGDKPQIEEAITKTEKWLAAHPEGTDVRTFYLGFAERNGNNDHIEAVIDETRSWLRLHPAASDVWVALIALLIRRREPLLVAQVASEAISHHPDDPKLLGYYLVFGGEEGRNQDTDKLVEDLRRRFPENRQLALNYAKYLSKAGRPELAEPEFEELLIQYPRYMWAHEAYGRHLLTEERYADAVQQFQEALALHSRYARSHEGLGQAMWALATAAGKNGDRQTMELYLHQAERSFKSAIYHAEGDGPLQARCYSSLGWFYVSQNRNDEALKAIERAIAERPEVFVNYWAKGKALKQMGRYEDAITSLETALAKAPQPLEPPAADEIPRLIQECKEAPSRV